MKKGILLIVILLLAACGGKDADKNANDSSNSASCSNNTIIGDNNAINCSGDSQDGDSLTCDFCYEEEDDCVDITDNSFDECAVNLGLCLEANNCDTEETLVTESTTLESDA